MKTLAATTIAILLIRHVSVLGQERPLLPESYLLMGQAQETQTPKADESIAGNDSTIKFLVAKTPSRVLTGIMTSSEANKNLKRSYMFASERLTHSVTIDADINSDWQNESDLSDPNGMNVSWIIRQQKKPEDGIRNFHSTVETGIFSSIALAVFWGRLSAGHSPSLLSRSQPAEARLSVVNNKYGRLFLLYRDRHDCLQFSQVATNYVASLEQDRKLSEFTSRTFSSGLASITTTCDFSCTVEQLSSAPWNAQIRTILKGNAGEAQESAFLVHVDDVATDVAKVDRVIDSVLALIPNGSNVVTNEKLSYEWSEDTICVVKDEAGIRHAEAITFAPPTSWWRVAVVPVLASGILLVAALLVSRLRRSE